MRAHNLDAVFRAGREAVLSGAHDREGAPSETGRWGPSLVLLPEGAVAQARAAATPKDVVVMGGGDVVCQ